MAIAIGYIGSGCTEARSGLLSSSFSVPRNMVRQASGRIVREGGNIGVHNKARPALMVRLGNQIHTLKILAGVLIDRVYSKFIQVVGASGGEYPPAWGILPPDEDRSGIVGGLAADFN